MRRKSSKTLKSKLISVVVPIYKQERSIKKDLARIYDVLQNLRYPTELICVVDGMVDKSFERAQVFAKKHKRVKVLGYEKNRGKGYAVRFGMSKSNGEIVAFIDSGMDVDPNGLSMLLEHFEWYKADVIVGSKRHPVSKITYPWQRRILSLGYQILVRLLFGLYVRDTQVGLKFYRREVIEKVLPRMLVKNYAFDIEMLAVAKSLGFSRIYEAPVRIRMEFGKGSALTSQKFLRPVWLMILDTLAVFYRLRITNYYSNHNRKKWQKDLEAGKTKQLKKTNYSSKKKVVKGSVNSERTSEERYISP